MKKTKKKNKGYQRDFTRLYADVYDDGPARREKALKIFAVIREHAGVDPKGLYCLDVGCSTGAVARTLAEGLSRVVGVDLEAAAVGRAAERSRRSPSEGRAIYAAGDALFLPFREKSFDVVVLNHVYEHVPDPRSLLEEARRVLRPGGFIYLGAASRFAVVEPHHGLPFLSWLPRSLAGAYLRAAGRGRTYYEELLGPWGLARLAGDFRVRDYTLAVLADPDLYHAADMIPPGSPIRKLPPLLLRLLYPLLPTFIWVLEPRP